MKKRIIKIYKYKYLYLKTVKFPYQSLLDSKVCGDIKPIINILLKIKNIVSKPYFKKILKLFICKNSLFVGVLEKMVDQADSEDTSLHNTD